jgi:hypothetical protein
MKSSGLRDLSRVLLHLLLQHTSSSRLMKIAIPPSGPTWSRSVPDNAPYEHDYEAYAFGWAYLMHNGRTWQRSHSKIIATLQGE